MMQKFTLLNLFLSTFLWHNAYTQCINPAPGGEDTNLTIWFKADEGVYENTGGSDPAEGGDVIEYWQNQASGGGVSHLIRSTFISGSPDVLDGGDPSYIEEGINFQPVVDFDGNDFFRTENTITYDNFMDGQQLSLYIVMKVDAGGVVSGWQKINYSSDKFALETNQVFFGRNNDRVTGLSMGTAQPRLLSFTAGSNNMYGYLEGSLTNSDTYTDFNGTGTAGNGYFTMGAFRHGAYFVDGQVAEIIMYQDDHASTEREKIESYLALKYALSLQHDYILSDNSVIWDYTGNALFNTNIIGIGRDDCNTLDVRKSKSSNVNSVLTLINGTSVGTPAAFGTDLSYLMIGHNNEAMSSTNETDLNSAQVKRRVSRTWKAEEVGTVGTVTIQLDMSQVIGVGGVLGENDLDKVRLLVDGDGTFASGATLVSPSAYDNSTDMVSFQHDFDGGSGYYFSIGSIDAGTAPLPVELLSFEAVLNEQFSALLKWEVASEINHAGYTVERSSDARNWSRVGDVKGMGVDVTTLQRYSLPDPQPVNGLVYYRLKVSDLDGGIEYSKIVSVEASQGLEVLEIFPNPADQYLQVKLPNASLYRLDLLTTLGQKVPVQVVSSRFGLRVNTTDIPDGVYFLTLSNSFMKYQKKIIIQH
ncbi:T9SS type A sorting domain-containing protein [Rapidithrix thailandica]|uniref:T9SS type A sorting domain-containing protein n=1 Tax=Rapidithrix thailandica TaxID=413964 RepID=A0AAW9SHD7_9BACT